MDDRNLRTYMAELIGTFAFVLLSAGSVYIASLGGWQPGGVWWQPGLVWVALAAGFIYAAALAVILPLSGGCLNPAVTLMLWVFRRLDGTKTFCLIVAQLLGAILAGGVLYLVLPAGEPARMASNLGAPHLNAEYLGLAGSSVFGNLLRGIGIELVLTFVLVFVIFGTLLDPRTPRGGSSWVSRLACLWVGLTLVACTLVAFPLTGAAFNPARWLGPVCWDWIQHHDAFRDHAPYWIGPTAGALLAGWVYTAFLLPGEEESHTTATPTATATRPAATSSALFRAKK